jgi:hypothetical protein
MLKHSNHNGVFHMHTSHTAAPALHAANWTKAQELLARYGKTTPTGIEGLENIRAAVKRTSGEVPNISLQKQGDEIREGVIFLDPIGLNVVGLGEDTVALRADEASQLIVGRDDITCCGKKAVRAELVARALTKLEGLLAV